METTSFSPQSVQLLSVLDFSYQTVLRDVDIGNGYNFYILSAIYGQLSNKQQTGKALLQLGQLQLDNTHNLVSIYLILTINVKFLNKKTLGLEHIHLKL